VQVTNDDRAEAVKLQKRALHSVGLAFGRDSAVAADAAELLVKLLIACRRWREAEITAREVFEARRRLFGQVSPATWSVLLLLGQIHRGQGRLDDARQDLDRAGALCRALEVEDPRFSDDLRLMFRGYGVEGGESFGDSAGERR